MHPILPLTLVLASIAVGAPTPSAEPRPNQLVVATALRDGDRLVAEPRLRVAPAGAGRIEIRDADGDGYSIRFAATPHSGEKVRFSANVDVTSGGRHHLANPVLIVQLGVPSAIEYQTAGMPHSFRIDFTVDRTE